MPEVMHPRSYTSHVYQSCLPLGPECFIGHAKLNVTIVAKLIIFYVYSKCLPLAGSCFLSSFMFRIRLYSCSASALHHWLVVSHSCERKLRVRAAWTGSSRVQRYQRRQNNYMELFCTKNICLETLSNTDCVKGNRCVQTTCEGHIHAWASNLVAILAR
jgi:hypothetical protein